MKLISLMLFLSAFALSGASLAEDPFSGVESNNGFSDGFGDGFNNDQAARTYTMRCAGCHGEGAGGRSGMAPNFSEEWHRLTKPDQELARNIRNGFKTPGKFYAGGSCPTNQLSDQEISEILTYMRRLVGQ